MNNFRRKNLAKIVEALSLLQEDLGAIRDEEQEAFDNIPENLCETERYERAEAAVDALDAAADSFEELLDSINEAIDA